MTTMFYERLNITTKVDRRIGTFLAKTNQAVFIHLKLYSL